MKNNKNFNYLDFIKQNIYKKLIFKNNNLFVKQKILKSIGKNKQI